MTGHQQKPYDDRHHGPGAVLNYAPPDPPTVSPGKVLSHAVATMVMLVLTTMFAGASAAATDGWSMSAIPVVIVAFLVAAGFARRRPGGRSLAIGIWIGVGLPLLIVGLCFGIAGLR